MVFSFKNDNVDTLSLIKVEYIFFITIYGIILKIILK